ncbi:MAG: Smr/MutS family protein [Deltaproteobacteria bacterium]|nr:Smr/MutS family protein [Deltaproteobacteria bacterium]
MTLQVSHDNLRELGWHRIQLALADRAATEPGRDALMQLGFLPDADTIASVLATVDELTQLLAKGGDLPLSGTRDLSLALMRARRGAVLQKDELLDIARTATACHGVRRHLLFHQVHHPRLGAKGLQLPELGTLARELSETFDAAGEIRDDASPELAAARARLIGLHRNVKERLETFLLRPELEGVLQDSFYTQREDRYVVPVISSFQREVPGIIHGTSNSGETVFVEPGELIEANNAIKVADATVRMEVERVLRIRSEWVRAEADALGQAMTSLIELDALQARARLAADLDAVVPLLADPANPAARPGQATDDQRPRGGLAAGTIQLRQARNPHLLLKGSRVVANDIALAPNQAFLVVTGPNTGGKTVTLSTVGTMLMMVSAGCPIPVSEGSVITPFSSLWALIGDAQDLERDLSTFSGHLKAIHTILDAAEPGALVLLDEIIVGTEPQQGAALAIAVLESLADRGARGFVTTHYERLKTLAYEDPRFANASVGVDPATQAPNFQLAIGRPGSSNPFDVALRLGFPSHLVQRARDVAGGHSGLGEALARLEDAERRADDAAREAGKARDLAAQERERLNSERLRLKREAKLEVEALAREAKDRIKELLAEIREARERVVESAHRFQDPRTGKSLSEDEKRSAQRLGDRLDEARALLPDEHPEGAAKPAVPTGPKDGGDLAPADARPGLAVWVRALDKLGEIVELRGERATVAVGIMKTQVHLSDLGRVRGLEPAASRPQAEAKRPADPARGGKPVRMVELPEDDARIPPPRTDGITADLRGARRDEVHERVEPLLDRAYRDGIDAIWVIHGHGTGALRDEVRELLSRSPQVAGYRRGRRHEGGDGVTIAFLARD